MIDAREGALTCEVARRWRKRLDPCVGTTATWTRRWRKWDAKLEGASQLWREGGPSGTLTERAVAATPRIDKGRRRAPWWLYSHHWLNLTSNNAALTSSLHLAYLSLVRMPVPLIVTLAFTGPKWRGGVRPNWPVTLSN